MVQEHDVGLTHVALLTTKPDASIAFYQKYAAMQVVHRRLDADVVRKDPLGALPAAVNGEGDSLIEEGKIRRLLAPPELIGRNREQSAVQFSVVRAGIA